MATVAEILRAKKEKDSTINSNLIPSFFTQTKDGKKIASIKFAFLKKLHLTREQYTKYTLLYDTREWKIVLDEKDAKDIREDIAFEGYSACVVSFQVHQFGNYAIYRKDRNTKQEKNNG